MLKLITATALVLALSAGGAAAKPAQCKDDKGKFTKCPAAAPATPARAADKPAKAAQCKDAKGKFTKCPADATPAMPASASAAPAKPTASTPAAKPTMATPAVKPSAAPMASPAGAPAGATAQCKDGTYSMSQHHSGTCSHHGGVASWLK